MIIGPDRFAALVIIDRLEPELETVLIRRFQFPVEVLTLDRYLAPCGQRIFRFEPILADVAADGTTPSVMDAAASTLDPSQIHFQTKAGGSAVP